MRINLASEEKKTALLLGNEAIARGAIEAGIQVACAYPGTPSTEILESLIPYAKMLDIHVEWSVNEKVALEVAIGASYAKARALVAMKHVGLNVASDALMTLTYTGVEGGLVIVSADDPNAHSSQNEQDNRIFARFAKAVCIEPYDVQSCKDYTKKSFELSEKFKIPVVLRTTTRVSHAKGSVELGEIEKIKRKYEFLKDVKRYVVVPKHTRILHKKLNKKLKEIEEYASKSEFNEVVLDGKLGIITSGVSRTYVKEAVKDLDNISILEIGFSNPLPRKLIEDFITYVDKVLVVEELEPYLEDSVKKIAHENGIWLEVHGKDILPRELEFTPEIVKRAVYKFVKKDYKQENLKVDINIPVPERPPVLCAGCPHRALFYAIKKVTKKKVHTGDIGCYTLGLAYKTIDTCLCMGASVTLAQGFYHVGIEEKPVAIVGDSTFIHAGITGLINASYNKANIVIIVLDNRTVAMTGLQPTPATGINAVGEKTWELDLERLAKVCGATYVKTVSPFNLKETIKTLEEALNHDGLAVVISKEPCALLARKMKLTKPAPRVHKDRCRGYLCQACSACVNLFNCPAIVLEKGKVRIIEELCTGCGVCSEVCPNDVFEPVEA